MFQLKDIVTKERLEAVAALAPKPEANGQSTENRTNNYSRLKVAEWLRDLGIGFRIKEGDSSGRTIYILDECPFNAEHKQDANISQDASGKLGAKCFHNSCTGNGWQEFKQAIGPPESHHYDPPLQHANRKKKADQTKAASSHSQKLRMVTMNTVTRKKANFLIPGWLPAGSLALGYGEGGVGKSTVILDWAARLSKGKPFHNSPNENAPGDIVLILAEDPLEFVVSRRLDAVEADDSRIHVIQGVETFNEDGDQIESTISLVHHKQLINDALSSLENPLLLVVDPIGQFIRGDMHRDNEVRETTGVLAEIAEKHQIAVILIAHEGKDQSRSAKNRFLGSVAFRNAARSAFWFTDDPEDEDRKLIYHTKSNLHRIMPPMAYRLIDTEHDVARVEWCSESIDLSADEVVTHRKDSAQRPKRLEAKEFIREKLADGNWLKVAELDATARKEGIASKTLWRAKNELKEVGEIQYTRDGETKEWHVRLYSNSANCAF